MRIAAATLTLVLALSAGAGQASAQGSIVAALPKTTLAQTAAGPLSYDIQRVLEIQGMGDRSPQCAGPGAAFLIVSYTVRNTGTAPQAANAVAHLTLLDPKGQALAPDRSAAGDLSELLPYREPVGPSIGPGVGMETIDVFVVALDRMAQPGWKLQVDKAAAIDLPKTVLSPYPPVQCVD
jgi:hypothetical protein